MSVNFGPTITGPDNGTLIVTANPGDTLRITWALGADSDISRYHGLIFGVEGVSGVDTTEISRIGASALELTGQGFDPGCFTCTTFFAGLCPGTPGSASLRIDAVPEPGTILLLGLGLTGFAGFGRKLRS